MFEFHKYQGTGNDFIIIDNRIGNVKIDNNYVKNLCDRKFGIGADGLILLENDTNTDFRMVYFNSDGNEGTMCGNGGRCIVAFAKSLGIISSKTKFIATDGEHLAEINNNSVSLKMLDVQNIKQIDNDYFLNTGSPHYVQFTNNINNIDIFNKGKQIRYNNTYKSEGTNVNFAEINENTIKVGTYERGVENETLSCGTGVTAVAICAYNKSNKKYNNFNIETKGGKLNVRLEEQNNTYTNIWLTGPAIFVFKGVINSM